MTDASHIAAVAADDYPAEFINALDHPDRIWEKPFRNHITRRCQHLLIALYFASEYGADIEDVRQTFDGFHALLCAEFNLSHDPKDFEDALKTLEGSFLVITNGRISFINPSVRDFLDRYLSDKKLLVAIASKASDASCAMRIVDQFRKVPNLTGADTSALLKQLIDFASKLNSIPGWKPIPNEPGSYRLSDIGNGERIRMLLDWWRLSNFPEFLDAAVDIARSPIGGFSAWSDANVLPDILVELVTASQSDQPRTLELASILENRIRLMLTSGLEPDDLDRLVKSIDENSTILHPLFAVDIANAIEDMIESVGNNLDHVEAESTLTEYIETVERLATRINHNPLAVVNAKRAVERRIDSIREEAAEEEELSVTGERELQFDWFDDEDLDNLFAPLLANDEEDLDRR